MDNEHLPPISEDQFFEGEEEEADQYENGNNMSHQQHQHTLQNQRYQLTIRYDRRYNRMPHSFWSSNPLDWLLRREGLVPIDQDDQENYPDDQPHQEPVQEAQEPILQQENDEYGNVNPSDKSQDQEPGVLQPVSQENCENIHDEDDIYIPQPPPPPPPPSPPPDVYISFFEILHYPYWQEEFREGKGEPIFSLTLPQIRVSFLIHRKHGQPGPYSTTIVTLVPLDLCNDYDEFFSRLGHSYELAVGVDLQNQPAEDHTIPGYYLSYVFEQEAVHVLDIDGIPWEQFRNQLIVVHAVECY